MKKQKHSIDLLFSLSLFMVFVICSFFVLLLQTNGYQQIIVKGKELESIHTPLAYIQTQVRSNETKDAIQVFQKNDIKGIMVKEPSSNSTLYIYKQDEKLKELRVLDSVSPDFATGTDLFDILDFKVERVDGKLHIRILDTYHQEQTLTIALHVE